MRTKDKQLMAAAARFEARMMASLLVAIAKIRKRVTITSLVRELAQNDVKGATSLLKPEHLALLEPSMAYVAEAVERGAKIAGKDVEAIEREDLAAYDLWLRSL